MSLITLRSENGYNGSDNRQSAANFSNSFKNGIKIKKGSVIELVSISIFKDNNFEIIAGENDTMLWRIGDGPITSINMTPNFVQHQLTLDSGSYSGEDLADHIITKLNESTLLPSFRGGWTCVYNETPKDEFVIDYTLQNPPTVNGEIIIWIEDFRDTTNYLLTAVDNEIELEFDELAMGGEYLQFGYGFHSDKSIFSDGGIMSTVISPIEILDEVTSFDLQENVFLNWKDMPGNHTECNFISEVVNDWEYNILNYEGDVGFPTGVTIQNELGRVSSCQNFSGGSGYAVNNTGTLSSAAGSGINGTYIVNSIGASGEITSIIILNPGSNYTITEDIDLISTSGVGSGSVCEIATLKSGDDGSGYAVNDIGDLTSDYTTGVGGKYKVIAIGPGGAITAVSITEGSGYLVNDVLKLSGSGSENAYVLIAEIKRVPSTYYGYTDQVGTLVISSSTIIPPTDESSWEYVFVLENKTSPSRFIQQGTGTMKLEHLVGGGGFDFELSNIYPDVVTSYVRSMFVDKKPGGDIYDSMPDSMDLSIFIEPSSGKFTFSIYQMQKIPGLNNEDGIWKDSLKLVDSINPESWSTLPNSPSNWITFVYGEDNVSVDISIDNVKNIMLSFAHDTAGSRFVFDQESTVVLSSDTAAAGSLLQDFYSTIRENFYPLHGVVQTSSETPFTRQKLRMGGIFSTEVIDKTEMVMYPSAEDDEEIELDFTDISDMLFSAIYKIGVFSQRSIVEGPFTNVGNGQPKIGSFDVSPNVADLVYTLGFEKGYTFQYGNASNPITSKYKVKKNITEPTLHVDMPDFNIVSHSGMSSDTGKCIAVIPKQEWNVDDVTGTLNYFSNYPIKIELNLSEDQIFYELSVRLRQPDGRLVNDIISPSEICIFISEGEEEKQKKLIEAILKIRN